MTEADNGQPLIEQATQSRTAGNVREAGDYYTRAGYRKLSDGCFHHRGVWPGVDLFRYAAVCYRVAGEGDRAENRSRQAVKQIEEVFNGRLPDETVKRAAWKGLGYEYIGDFRTIATLANADTAYETARELYDTVEQAGPPDPIHAWTAETGFDLSTEFLLYSCDATEKHIDEETYFALRTRSLTSRIDFRIKNMEQIVSDLASQEAFEWSDDARKPPE